MHTMMIVLLIGAICMHISYAQPNPPPVFPNVYIYTFNFIIPSQNQYGTSIGFYDWPNGRQRVKDVYYPNITESIYDSVIWGKTTEALYMVLQNGTETCQKFDTWTPMTPPNLVATTGKYGGIKLVNGQKATLWTTNYMNQTIDWYFSVQTNQLLREWFHHIDQGFDLTSLTPVNSLPAEFFKPDPHAGCPSVNFD